MIYAIAAALVLVLDQAVKFWTTKTIPLDAIGDQCVQLIPKVLHVTNIHNTGAAFSILRDSRWVLVGVSAVFVIVILVLISQEIIHTRFGKWTSVLVMAGAMGNCVDRIIYGYVVDMLELELELFTFPVFNVADIFITVCGILFCIHVIFYNDPAAAARSAAIAREKNGGKLPPSYDDEEEPAPARRGRKARAEMLDEEEEPAPARRGRRARTEEPDEEDERPASARQSRKARAKENEERYAAIPHRERSAHRTLEEEMRPADPEDPFKEWSFGAREDDPFVEDGTAARRRRADPFLEGEDSYIEEERPAPRRARRQAENVIEEEPIPRRNKKIAPTVAEPEEDDWSPSIDLDRIAAGRNARRSAAPARRPEEPAPVREEPARDDGGDDDDGGDGFSLEDILNEFRDT